MKILFRTANHSPDMRLSAAICTANIAAVADGEWALIAPYGEHASPGGSYVQRFSREQAERVVQGWNSLSCTAVRWFKNALHGRLTANSIPVWDGHPETDKQRWPKEKLLAEITELRLGETGLEGRVTWNAKGETARTRGPLYPSPLWWHWPPAGEPPEVFPELLESIGLVTTPNISGVPAWTANANPLAGVPAAENQDTQDTMTPEQLAALRKALGLPDTADAATCIATATANAAQLTEREGALSTANSAKATLETQLSTANSQVTAITTECDTLRTANGTLTTEVETLRTGLLDLAEKKGAITPAERETFKTRLTTANTAGAAIAELQTRKAMNTQSVELNGNRIDLSTANARQTALDTAVTKRMKDDSCDYDTAFARVQADPTFAPLFGAMQDPTKKAA